jgi:hypothetical protein
LDEDRDQMHTRKLEDDSSNASKKWVSLLLTHLEKSLRSSSKDLKKEDAPEGIN